MHKAIAILMAVLLVVVSACNMVPKKQYVTEEPITTEAGVLIPAGTPVFVDEAGEPTVKSQSADGKSYKPLMEEDVEKIEKFASQAESTASAIPFGIGGIAGLIVGIIGSAGVAGLRKKRAGDRAEVNEKLKGKPEA